MIFQGTFRFVHDTYRKHTRSFRFTPCAVYARMERSPTTWHACNRNPNIIICEKCTFPYTSTLYNLRYGKRFMIEVDISWPDSQYRNTNWTESHFSGDTNPRLFELDGNSFIIENK